MSDEKNKTPDTIDPKNGGINSDINRELDIVQSSSITTETSGSAETPPNGAQGSANNPGNAAGRRPYTRSGNYTKEKLAAAKAQAEGQAKIEETQPEAEKITLPMEAVRDMIKIPFDLVALFRGDHWRIEDKELYSFERPMQRYLENKMPEWLKENLDAVLIGQGLARLAATRIIEDRKIHKGEGKDA